MFLPHCERASSSPYRTGKKKKIFNKNKTKEVLRGVLGF
jgi:hypothetical protein